MLVGLLVLAALLAAPSRASEANESWCIDSAGTAVDLSSATCFPLNNSASEHTGLTFCTEFEEGCCDAALFEPIVRAKVVSKLMPIFGNGSCFDSLRQLQCALACWTCTANHYVSNGDSTYNVTFYLSETFARGLFESCGGVCLSAITGGPEGNISSIFKTAEKFIDVLQTDYDPTYTISLTNPRVTYKIGTSPEGGSYNGVTTPSTAQDNIGCTGNCSGGAVLMARNLTFCTEYANASCCAAYKDATMGAEMPDRMQPVTGSDCCYRNFKRMYCAWMCAPDNANITSWEIDSNNVRNMTLYMSERMASKLWNSCKNHPLRLQGCREYYKYFDDVQALLDYFNSENDKEHKPNPLNNRAAFKVGKNPKTGGAWDNIDLLEDACGADLTGCTLDPDSEDSSPSLAIYSSVLAMIFALTL